MKVKELKDFLEKEVTVYVRFGFKKHTDETQSYTGILKDIEKRGIILDRKTGENLDIKVLDFFPWHNIDVIRLVKYDELPWFIFYQNKIILLLIIS